MFCSSSRGIESCKSSGHLPVPHTTTSMLHGVGIVPLVIIQHAAEARQLQAASTCSNCKRIIQELLSAINKIF